MEGAEFNSRSVVVADEGSKDEQSGSLSFQAELPPSEAADVRDMLLAGIKAAKDGDKTLALDLEGEPVTPCAIQLLVASTHSAAAAGVRLVLSEQADKILASVQAD